MNERVMQFRVGVVVVAATIITGILIMLFGEARTLIQKQYTIYLQFSRAPGVTVDTPVRKHGVTIGRVTDVELLPEGGVLLTVRIDADRRIRKNEIPVIKTASLLGDAVIDFVPSDTEFVSTQAEEEQPQPQTQQEEDREDDQRDDAAEYVQEGDLIAEGRVQGDPLEVLTGLEDDIRSALGSIDSAANQFERLAGNLNETIGGNGEQLQRIMDKSELALEGFQSAMETVNELVGDPQIQEDLKRALADLPELFDELRVTMNSAQDTFKGFEQVSQRADRNLANLEDFTGPLGERGEEVAENMTLILDNVERITSELMLFSETLNQGQGTLGRLISDDALYQKLDEAATNINASSRRIRPILDDVRTFTDKVARDPRVLGVKGALDRRPLNTGLKEWPVR